MRTKIFCILLSAVTAAALLGACGDDDHDMGGGTGPDTGSDMDDGMNHDDDEPDSPVADGARRIEVTASSFEFDPAEITAESGEDIAIVLTSEDIEHDFVIDELEAHISADGGESGEGGFAAGEPGEYTYYCSVLGHRGEGMEGTLVVE